MLQQDACLLKNINVTFTLASNMWKSHEEEAIPNLFFVCRQKDGSLEEHKMEHNQHFVFVPSTNEVKLIHQAIFDDFSLKHTNQLKINKNVTDNHALRIRPLKVPRDTMDSKQFTLRTKKIVLKPQTTTSTTPSLQPVSSQTLSTDDEISDIVSDDIISDTSLLPTLTPTLQIVGMVCVVTRLHNF